MVVMNTAILLSVGNRIGENQESAPNKIRPAMRNTVVQHVKEVMEWMAVPKERASCIRHQNQTESSPPQCRDPSLAVIEDVIRGSCRESNWKNKVEGNLVPDFVQPLHLCWTGCDDPKQGQQQCDNG